MSTRAGWCNVACVTDADARRILGWCSGSSVTTQLVLDAVEQAIRIRGDVHGATGFELVVVDALEEAAAGFHVQAGFTRFADHPLRLFMLTKDVRITFGPA